MLWAAGDYDFIHKRAQGAACFTGSRGGCDDDAFGALLPDRIDRSQHGAAGCDAVIDKNDGFAADFEVLSVLLVGLFTPMEFAQFARGDFFNGLLGKMKRRHYGLMNHAHSAAGDGAKGEFLVTRYAEFAYDQNSKRQMEAPGHSKCNRYSAAR